MDAIREFLSMGGYWPYVWPSYAVAAIGLGGLAWQTRLRLRAVERRLAALDALRGRRRRAR